MKLILLHNVWWQNKISRYSAVLQLIPGRDRCLLLGKSINRQGHRIDRSAGQRQGKVLHIQKLTRLKRGEFAEGYPLVLPGLARHRQRHAHWFGRSSEVEVRQGQRCGRSHDDDDVIVASKGRVALVKLFAEEAGNGWMVCWGGGGVLSLLCVCSWGGVEHQARGLLGWGWVLLVCVCFPGLWFHLPLVMVLMGRVSVGWEAACEKLSFFDEKPGTPPDHPPT